MEDSYRVVLREKTFQFLIGKLRIVSLHDGIPCCSGVSIPYR